MIGKVLITTDPGPHCYNGWSGTPESPSCNYTGGHFCDLPLDHKPPCRCHCGATCKRNRWLEEERTKGKE